MLIYYFFVLDVCCIGLLDLFLQIFNQQSALLLIFNTALQVNSTTEKLLTYEL